MNAVSFLPILFSKGGVDRQQKWPENRRLKWPEIWENEVEAFRRLHRRREFRRSLFEVGMRREE